MGMNPHFEIFFGRDSIEFQKVKPALKIDLVCTMYPSEVNLIHKTTEQKF